jgi:hypothetical protein
MKIFSGVHDPQIVSPSSPSYNTTGGMAPLKQKNKPRIGKHAIPGAEDRVQERVK